MEERKQIALKFLKEIFETDETQNFLDYKDIVSYKPYCSVLHTLYYS